MRKLMYFTLGFGASCALCAYLLPKTMVAAAMAAFGTMSLLFGVLSLRWRDLGRGTLLFLGGTLACLWFQQYYTLYLNQAVEADGKVLTVQVHVTEFSYDTDYGSAVECRVDLGGKKFQAKAYLKEKQELAPGTELKGDFRFRITTPDGEKAATYHQGRGVFLLLYQEGGLEAVEGERSFSDRIAVLRRSITGILEGAFPEDTLGFAKALLLGDTGDLGYSVDADLKVSGIRHVAAVSGLHVSILFALVSTLAFKNRILTAVLGYPALLLFAALAGFTPSVTRSCLMLSLTLLGLLLEKEYDGPTALSFAVLTMLCINPLTITDIGFQLSVASVAGIFAFAAPIAGWVKGDRKGRGAAWTAASMGTTLSAMVFTTPLCAAYFGTVSLVSVVTNLLTLWVISFIFYGIMAVCLLGFFWAEAAAVLGWAVAWPIRYVLLAAKLLSHVPLAAVYTKSGWITAWLVLCYLLAALGWICRKLRPRVLIFLAVLGLSAALCASWYRPLTDEVRFTVLDVGQGQSLILQAKGRTFLVDCGGGSESTAADEAAQTLLSQGISRLDGVIVTHSDDDHFGGVPGLLSRVDTDLLILPQGCGGQQLQSAGRILSPDRDLEIRTGDVKIRIFVPRYQGSGNKNSLCVLFDTENCDILITGDRDGFGERSLLRNASIPEVDILVAGHHGSKTSACRELLEAVKPEIVCISVGKDNPYGHPSSEVLERLEEFGCAVYRTDINGEILIRG